MTTTLGCSRCGGTDGVADDATRCGWCRPTYRVELVNLPDVIGADLVSTYPDGRETRWQFVPSADGAMRYSVKTEHGWGGLSRVTNPERFGTVPSPYSTPRKRALDQLRAWVEAFATAD